VAAKWPLAGLSATTLLIVDSPFRVGIELSWTTERALRWDSVFVWSIIEEVPAPQDKEGSFLAMAV
jgi:hypothetical protein